MNIFFIRGFITGCVLIFALIFSSCHHEPGPVNQVESVRDEFPALEEAIISREYQQILPFIYHEDSLTARLAKRAITKTEPPNPDEFVQIGLEQDDKEAWHMISLRPIDEQFVLDLFDKFKNGEIQSHGVCEVFRQLGRLEVIEELAEMPDVIGRSYACSRAVGVILSRQKVNELTVRDVLNVAFSSDDIQIRKNLLYGLYRSSLNRPQTGGLLNEELVEFYRLTARRYSADEDKMLTRIVGRDLVELVMMKWTDTGLNRQVQLSVELAANLAYFSGDELNHEIVIRLLNHRNSHVVVQVLTALTEVPDLDDDLIRTIEVDFTKRTRNHEIFAVSLALLQENGRDIKPYRHRLDFAFSENPYLADRLFPLYRQMMNHEDYMRFISKKIDGGGIVGYHAFQSLIPVFIDYFEQEGFIEWIREMVLKQLGKGDTSVVRALERFLQNEFIITPDDFDLLNRHFQRYIRQGEYEKAAVLTRTLEFHARDEFEGSFEIPQKEMRPPSWDRLYEMGLNPYWILKTNRGTIEIRMDPLTAPFTVSSIDSLTRAGKYDGVPFHRVIGNFVIQSGDFERRDGSGGPGYRLPTEPSFESFKRGMVGVASSGTDTEGSQFFITLNPTPHLDGFYTMFGEVVRGMDVAERIQIGDRVEQARISIR